MKNREVYEKVWDLTQEDTKELSKVGLEKALYKYIGRAGKTIYLSNRKEGMKNKYINETSSKKLQDFFTRLEEFYKNKGLSKEECYEKMFIIGDVIDIAETDEELELKEKMYITRLDDISHTLDGLIVEDKIISLNTIDSMLKHMKCEGVTITSLKVDKIDILLKKMKAEEVQNQ